MKQYLVAVAVLASIASPGQAAQIAVPYNSHVKHSPDTLTAGAEGVLIEARVVRRGVVVGPRGRVRTFTYRGRPLAALRRPAFIYPPGFAYRRWAVGALLPAALIAAPFLFLEYQALGLQPPPPGQVWVRHGPDVILIDEKTRKVHEVAYGAIEEE